MTEKLRLQWNDFTDNVNCAFRSLRDEADFADVILACEDGKQVEAHKVILAVSSPFFQNLLRRNTHPHPLIYMRGIKSEDLVAIVDFLYCGEANVFQDNLDSFLAIAEELHLKGFSGQDCLDDRKESVLTLPKTTEPTKRESKTLISSKRYDQIPLNGNNKANRSVAFTTPFSGELQELDEQVSEMLEKTHNVAANGKTLYACKVCGKEGEKRNIMRHIEANHLEGISIPCNICGKTSRSRHSLTMHMRNKHPDY